MQVGHYFSENLPGAARNAAPQCSLVAALCQCHSAELYVVCCADGKMHGLRTHDEAFFQRYPKLFRPIGHISRINTYQYQFWHFKSRVQCP